MNTTTTGRYRILAKDQADMIEAGYKQGEQVALDALRLGLGFDSWPGLEYVDHQTETAAWNLGLSWWELDVNAKVTLSTAFIDGYRAGYATTREEEN